MAKMAQGHKGARRPALSESQYRRTALRSVAAIAAGRVPGKPGPSRTVVGSKGGHNAARAADRAAKRAAKKAGFRPKPAKRILRRPAAAAMQRPAAAGTLHLLEVCAYKDSKLSHEWAKRGFAAVRVAHRCNGKPPKPGPEPVLGRAQTWYLDLGKDDDKDALMAYAAETQPEDLWTSPDCTAFTGVQRINKGRTGARPKGEEASMQMLSYCRDLHTAQQERGGRSHHEQSASSHAPFDSDEWPWAISKPPVSVKVAGCAVGLTDHKGEKLLAKEWRIESSSFPLLASLEPYKCPGGHEHGESLGSGRLWRTAKYTPFLAQLVATVLLME